MRTEVSRRRTRQFGAAAVALLLSLIGGVLVLMFSGGHRAPAVALKPVRPSAPATSSVPAAPVPSTASGLFDSLGSGADAPAAAASSAAAPAFQLPAPQLPAAPPVDWAAVLQPLIQSQPTLPPAPDFAALASAFAAAAGQPPLGVPSTQWPQLPPPAGLPSPDQVAAALAAIPPVGLPPLPPPLGFPDLPPPPPIGPPPMGLPPVGLPSIGLPDLAGLFGPPS